MKSVQIINNYNDSIFNITREFNYNFKDIRTKIQSQLTSLFSVGVKLFNLKTFLKGICNSKL